MVEASSSPTAVHRSSRGMATASACTSTATAAESSRSRTPAAAEVQRWSSPWGVMRTPARAAAAATCGNEAAGSASQPNTSAWAKSAPVSFEARSTKPVRRLRSSAVVLNRVCNRSANGAMVVMRRPPSLAKVFYILSMPRVPSLCLLSLMRMAPHRRRPFSIQGHEQDHWWGGPGAGEHHTPEPGAFPHAEESPQLPQPFTRLRRTLFSIQGRGRSARALRALGMPPYPSS